MSTTAVSWRRTPETSLALRLTVYAAVGSLVGPVVALVVGVAGLLVRTGSVELLLLVAVVTLVGVGLANRGALLAARSEDVRGGQEHRDTRALSRRALAAAVVVGAGAAATIQQVDPSAVVLLVASGFGWLVLGTGLRTEGEVRDGTLHADRREVSLSALAGVRHLRTGPRVWLWLSYEPGTVGATAPRLLSVPVAAYADVEAAFEWGIGADAEVEASGRQASTAVRVVAVGFGLAFLAAGPVLWLALPAGEGAVVALYAGSLGGLFGLVFLWYALVG